MTTQEKTFANFTIAINKNIQSHRSLPIPKQVNNFILNNYGEEFYGSKDPAKKTEILKQIESECLKSGYLNITAMEIERRLKNMKSHYRRKKQEEQLGTTKLIAWEYFKTLDKIFKGIEKKDEKVEETKSSIDKNVKRKSEEQLKKESTSSQNL